MTCGQLRPGNPSGILTLPVLPHAFCGFSELSYGRGTMVYPEGGCRTNNTPVVGCSGITLCPVWSVGLCAYCTIPGWYGAQDEALATASTGPCVWDPDLQRFLK